MDERRTQWGEALRRLMKAFEHELDKETIEIYWHFTRKHSPERWNHIVDTAIEKEKMFPRIATLLEIARTTPYYEEF